jgi:hypothetical protein
MMINVFVCCTCCVHRIMFRVVVVVVLTVCHEGCASCSHIIS